MKRRSVPCIALRPSNNWGGYNFMSIQTGKKLHGYHWKELPMDDWVISRVESLARKEGQPLLVDKTPIFEWSPGEYIIDEQDDIVAPVHEYESEEEPLAENEEPIQDVEVHNLEDENEHLEIIYEVTDDSDMDEEDIEIDIQANVK